MIYYLANYNNEEYWLLKDFDKFHIGEKTYTLIYVNTFQEWKKVSYERYHILKEQFSIWIWLNENTTT